MLGREAGLCPWQASGVQGRSSPSKGDRAAWAGRPGRGGRTPGSSHAHGLGSLEEPQPFARALSTGACSARSVLFPNKRSWGQGWGGVFVVCLLEPVAAPGLTFKASNAAFQAAPAGGHGCGGKLLRLKCHVGLETRRGAGASPHLRAARAPSCPPSDTAVLSEAALRAWPADWHGGGRAAEKCGRRAPRGLPGRPEFSRTHVRDVFIHENQTDIGHRSARTAGQGHAWSCLH